MEDYVKLQSLISDHTNWRHQCLNLIASENVSSPSVHNALGCDLTGRYGTFRDTTSIHSYTSYAGTQYTTKITNSTTRLAQRLFKAAYVDIRPLSGNIADVVTILGLTAPGDLIINTAAQDGGHTHYIQVPNSSPSLKREWKHWIFDEREVNIDVDASVKMLEQVEPKLVILGASHMLFPLPVKELVDAAKTIGTRISYDASHILGLIAGKKFQDPLREGVEIVHSSTHKTFGGPQGAIVFSNNEEIFSAVSKVIYPALQDNPHFNRVLALGITLSEVEQFGGSYAQQVIANAKALAEALHARGFHLLGEHKGFTQSHLCRVDFKPYISSGAKGSEMLESANIIVSLSSMPEDSIQSGKTGARVGVAEMTRIGMKENEMEEIAEFWKMVIIEKKDPQIVAKLVSEFRTSFQKVHYCFDLP